MFYFRYLSLFLIFALSKENFVTKTLFRVYEIAKVPYSNVKFSVGINKDENFKHFMMPESKKIEIKTRESCENKMFPHGIFINSINDKPMMYCETHKCFKPQQIHCQKNILPSECNLGNQWITGIYQKHKNETILTVDCCQYKGISSGKFVKHINISKAEDFIHEIAIKEGRMFRFGYVNNLKMDKYLHNLTVLKLDLYEMDCPTEPWQLKTFDNFVKNDMLGPPPKYKNILVYENNALDQNYFNRPSKDIWNPYFGCKNTFIMNQYGIKISEDEAEIKNSCGIFGFPHGFFIDMITFIPRMYCIRWPMCFDDPNKVICRRETGKMRCKNENEWMAGFIPNKGVLELECCHYEDIHSATFIKNISMDALDIFTHDIYRKSNHRYVGFTYVNGLTKKEKNGELLYTASVYRMKCPQIDDREFIALLSHLNFH